MWIETFACLQQCILFLISSIFKDGCGLKRNVLHGDMDVSFHPSFGMDVDWNVHILAWIIRKWLSSNSIVGCGLKRRSRSHYHFSTHISSDYQVGCGLKHDLLHYSGFRHRTIIHLLNWMWIETKLYLVLELHLYIFTRIKNECGLKQW